MALKLNNINPVSNTNQNVNDQRLYPNPPKGNIGDALLGNFLQRGKVGVRRRQVITWQLPNRLESIQMYINPQQFELDKRKLISQQRTRSGYIVQYWGEEFDKISLSGTTGSGGIEGINILNDIYRAEQSEFEGVAQALLRRVKSGDFSSFVSGDIVRNVANLGSLFNQEQTQPGAANRLMFGGDTGASLADIATNVIMEYQGISYRGFFTAFRVTESADKLGLFDYRMDFTVIQTRGIRDNFMPFHRAPVAPADYHVTPLSFSTEINGASTGVRAIAEVVAGVFQGIAGVNGVSNARQSLFQNPSAAQVRTTDGG